MKRILGLSLAAYLAVTAAVAAAGPKVSKTIVSTDGSSVVLLRVTAGSSSIYGVSISDPSGSIVDVVGPKGWVALATDSEVYCRTIDSPIKKGQSLTFRIVTTNPGAKLSVDFRDAKTKIGSRKAI